MRRTSFFILAPVLAVLCLPAFSQTPIFIETQPASISYAYYVSNGDALRPVNGDPSLTDYSEWQVWLYPHNVRLPRSGAGLAYVRWGLIQGGSAKDVMEQLRSYQRFEEAYTNLFGEGTWGSTFSYSVGPIAITKPSDAANPYVSRADLLNRQLKWVVANLYFSLANAEPSQKSASLRPYFDEVRDSMQDIARFSSKMTRLPNQQSYLSQELAMMTPRIMQAESVAPKVISILPHVKLPLERQWMMQTENEGKDGIVTKTVTELGNSAWVEQSWTGGDGAMSGASIITIIPYQAVGNLEVSYAPFGNQQRWTLEIQSARPAAFPQTVTGPERVASTATYPAVDLNSNVDSVFLEFPNPAEAQDAYSFFLYHKERGM